MIDKLQLEERTIRLNLTNKRDTDIEFYLEPEGMNLLIPPNATYEIVISQKSEIIEIVFKGTVADQYFSIYSDDLPKVYQNGKHIHG